VPELLNSCTKVSLEGPEMHSQWLMRDAQEVNLRGELRRIASM
jgi:hypothetical protein